MPLDTSVAMLSATPFVAATLGGLAGAVTPRIAYRWSVEWGEPLRPSCESCGTAFPAGPLGWLGARSRCGSCRVRLGPSPWWAVPVGAISAGLLAIAYADQPWVLPAALLLSMLGVLLAAIDLAVSRLPDPIMLVAAVGTLLLLAIAALGTGDWSSFGRALLGGLALLLVYGVLALIAGGGLGLGDVKLAAVLGLLLGWTGWGAVILGGAFAALLNGLVTAILLLARRVSWRGSLPMGPSLLAGALLAVVVVALR